MNNKRTFKGRPRKFALIIGSPILIMALTFAIYYYFS